MQSKDRIQDLRREMSKRGIDIYIVPTSDFHESEWAGDHFKAREYLTGFTGSAGTAIIATAEAGLWTDGRYFVQAERQLQGSGVRLFKMGEEGVPSIAEYIKKELRRNGCLGFDGRVINGRSAEEYAEITKEKNASLSTSEDLVGLVWEDRPPLSAEPAFILQPEYSGESTVDKLRRLREKMEMEGASIHILTSLYDIAWLLNIRGNDIPHVPVVLSFLAVTKTDCLWFVNEAVLDDKVRSYLKENHISIRAYEEIYAYAAQMADKDDGKEKVLLNKGMVNDRIISLLGGTQILDRANPTELMKAVKNPNELANTVKAHVKDGVAVTKFIYWIKTQIGKQHITEISASDYLEERRREQGHFLDLSFDTISAYGSNGAMLHYSAHKESNAVLEPSGFYLVDSGGHYLEGSTDVTRTLALGPLSQEEKLRFTAVCRGMLNLSDAKFLHGCRGINLDILARSPLWEMDLDYKSGTGHGVGHILNVHEGPNGFRWKIVPERMDSAILEEGMITTVEPGLYLEGKYGIRIENELICRKGVKNEHGQFMYFETITMAPIDLDAILPEAMNPQERKRLNDYHKKVYETISPYLAEEERVWLQKFTREI